MSLTRCPRCDFENDQSSPYCENCRLRLDEATLARARWEQADAGLRAAAEDELPVDLQSARFESVGDALGPTARVYREHFVLFGKIVMAATVPLVAAQYALASVPSLWVGVPITFAGLASFLIDPLMTGAIIYALVNVLTTGRAPTLADSYRWGFSKWWKVFACTILATVVTWIGLILLIVPGIIASVAFTVALPAVVVEKTGPVAALKRSAELTKGSRVLIFLTASALWAIIFVVSWMTVGLGGAAAHAGASFVASLVYAAVNQLLASAYTVLTLFIYLGLRAEKEGADAQQSPALPTVAAQG